MPIHVAPRIRALEEAEEAVGLIVSLDSAGVTVQKALESAGAPKVVPVAYTTIFKNTKRTAS